MGNEKVKSERTKREPSQRYSLLIKNLSGILPRKQFVSEELGTM